MKDLFNIKNKVVAFTGATGVLGQAISAHLAEEGAKVALLGRNIEKGEILAESIRKEGGDAVFVAVDVLDRDSVAKACETVLRTYGRIDILLNGAGGNLPGATIAPDKTLFDLDTDAFKQVVDLNLLGTVVPTILFAGEMAKQKQGVIVNFSSESSLRPLTRVAGYGTAKAAVNNFTKYMAAELALKFGEGIRVNAIAPGFFLTDQNRDLLTTPDGAYTDRARTIIAHTPFRRFGTPDELLGTIQYLISDASKFVTGTVAVVDGGFDAFSI